VFNQYAVWLAALPLLAAVTLPVIPWKPNDRSRPVPPAVTHATPSTQQEPGKPPSDATVLFNGKDLSNWEGAKGGPAQWIVRSGYFEVAPGTGDIRTKQAFGDCQLHAEWASPNPPRGKDQDRGNSGISLMGLYEIQVLDTYKSPTYADGMVGAVYGQWPPLVSAALPPGEWQTYDVVFHGPRFADDGALTRLATVTLLHNGVLVQDHVSLTGPTAHMSRPPYKKTPDRLPLQLQDHHHPVHFRNIWIRELRNE